MRINLKEQQNNILYPQKYNNNVVQPIIFRLQVQSNINKGILQLKLIDIYIVFVMSTQHLNVLEIVLVFVFKYKTNSAFKKWLSQFILYRYIAFVNNIKVNYFMYVFIGRQG